VHCQLENSFLILFHDCAKPVMGKSVLKEESCFDPLVFEDLLRFRNGLS
jgi:hypothetical protein